MNIQYQNNRTGAAHDVTELIMECRWVTKRTGSPATLEMTLRKDPAVVWAHGGIVSALDAGHGFFHGYVFKLSENEDEEITVMAYDQTRYLKNKDTYVFAGRRGDEIAAQIAADFKLKTGALDNTGYVIPSMVEDSKTLFDIILKALDLTLVNTGRMFILWDDFGSLRVSEVKAPNKLLIIGDRSLATGYTYDSDIDSETYNKVKLVRDNKDTGKRDVYIFQDSNNMKFWGILQSYEKVDENMGEGQIKAMGDKMLELYNRPKRSLQVGALSDLSVRAGGVVQASIESLSIYQPCIVEEASHDLIEETMDLKLRVV